MQSSYVSKGEEEMEEGRRGEGKRGQDEGRGVEILNNGSQVKVSENKINNH